MTNDLTPTTDSVPALSDEDLALMQGAAKTDDFKREDLTIPFLVIVQSTSSYIIRGDADFIESARPGDILDTMNKTPRQKVAFVPVKYAVTYSEWKPNRGGLVQSWGEDRTKYDASNGSFGTRKTVEGHDIVPAATYYGLVIAEDGSTTEVVLNMSGSQFKKSRRLNSLINMLETRKPDGEVFTPPMYARVYAMETVQESNDLGNWFGWKIEPGAMLLKVDGGKSIFQRADKMRRQLDEGTARAAATPTAAQTGAAGVQTGRSQVDEVPF
jgi:hypothetical protein